MKTVNDPRTLKEIAAAASTIDERIAGRFVPAAGGDPGGRAERNLEAWRTAATRGDSEKFVDFLAGIGIDEASVLPLLGPVQMCEKAEAPSWIIDLEWILDGLSEAPDEACSGDIPGVNVRYAPVLAPLVSVGRRHWKRDIRGWQSVLTQAASDDLLASLMRRLNQVAETSLRCEMAAVTIFQKGARENENSDLPSWFVRLLGPSELRALLIAQPVLARLVATTMRQWFRGACEMVDRLGRDYADLRRSGLLNKRGKVSSVMWDLSDPHNGGRSVACLVWKSGEKLIYKPRPLAAEAAWQRLMAWFELKAAPFVPIAVPALDRESHGWMACAERQSCENPAGAELFYNRLGATIAIACLLRGSDLHGDNFIAIGDSPVLVDAETIVSDGVSDRLYGPGAPRLGEPLATEILPHQFAGWGGQSIYFPGFDNRFHASADAATGHSRQFPVVEGIPILMLEKTAALKEGYSATVDWISVNMCEVSAPTSPIASFDQIPVRYVRRPTQTYATVLALSRSPQALCDGARWSVAFDTLHRFDNPDEPLDVSRDRRRFENASLAQCDIPYFRTHSKLVMPRELQPFL